MARCPACHRRLISGRRCSEHGELAPVRAVLVDAAPAWSGNLGACLGAGGFASVWEIAGSSNVLKVAHANHDLARARLAREAEALAAIGPPAVPALVARGVLADGRPWITMVRIIGDHLGDVIAAGPLRVDHAIAHAAQLLDAVARIHAAGFVHRDLKPENIVPDVSSATILDLGLARRSPDDPDDPNRAGVQVGSVEYMPPEQWLDATIAGVTADIYAVGCVLYELCAGRPPFVGDATALERAHAALRPPPLGALARVPTALVDLVDETLSKQPSRRPQDAAELAERLRSIAGARRRAPPGREDSAAGAPRTMSMIREGRQPVVLLWAELPRVDRSMLAALAARRIAIVSQRGRRVLGGVVGAEHAHPANAAIAAARELATAGARVALHLDALIVTPSAHSLSLAGASVEHPDTWLPPGGWTGVLLTRAFAAVIQASTRRSEYAGFAALDEVGGDAVELVGRDALIGDLLAEASAAFAAGPGLAVVVGDAGVGKTALAAAIGARVAALGARVVETAVPAPGSGKPGWIALVEAVVSGPEAVVPESTVAPGREATNQHAAAAPAASREEGADRREDRVSEVGDTLRAAARHGPIAIVIDDVHLADHELLDALEYATLGGEPLPLWILAIAAPRLDQRRPELGKRAERHRRDVLAPLDEDAAVALATALLRPAAYPALRALRRIAALSGGNPLHLASLAREIRERGAIRARPNGEHFLDTTALDALLAGRTAMPLGAWLAARELADLGDEVIALARVCAVLGDDLGRAELAAVMHAVEQHGGATTTIDVDVGLAELVSHEILIADQGTVHWSFRRALLAEGIYATTHAAERRAIHVAALAYERGRGGDPARIARHAEAAGERRSAAEAFAELGARAHAEHRSLDADQAWQGAVRNLDERDLARGRALLGRARARYRLQRVRDALADLDEAIAIADEQGDHALAIAALLEKATALDWSDDFAGSAAVAEAARARWQIAPVPELAPELALATARVVYREGRHADVVPMLHAVLEDARTAGHAETQAIAGILLAPSLVEIGDLDGAERMFARSIELCEQLGDRLHLGAAYANRTVLWAARDEVARVAEDLRFVIRLARELGQAVLERIATYNLAEDLLWAGELDEALRLARRSLTLQLGHGEGSVWPDQLLLARIHAARGEVTDLAPLVDALAAVELAPPELATLAVLRCARARAPAEAWRRALAVAGPLVGDKQARELARLAERSW